MIQQPLSSRLVFLGTLFLAAGTSMPGVAATPGDRSGQRIKMLVEDAAVYRVTFAELANITELDRPIPSGSIAVVNRGEPVPVHVEDHGDGRLHPGDWLEFLGQRIPGESSYLNEYARYNVYWLEFDPARRQAPQAWPEVETPPEASPPPRVCRHLEEDLFLLRFPASATSSRELWHWHKLTMSDPEPLEVALDLRGLDTASGESIRIRLDFQGWSTPKSKPDSSWKDHRVGIMVNGRSVATAEWDTGDGYVQTLELEASELSSGENTLSLRVLERSYTDADGEQRVLVDVAMLNWVEVDYPHTGEVAGEQVRYSNRHAVVQVHGAGDAVDRLIAWSDAGARRTVTAEPGSSARMVLAPEPDATQTVVTGVGALRSPVAMVLDRPSHLSTHDRQADYIIITHRRLSDAIEPLAVFHRQNGLNVVVTDVEDVYDEFNHGIYHPRAIRDFLWHAYHSWRRPRPRFVLLVGDASWDHKSPTADDMRYPDWTFGPKRERERFRKNTSYAYEEYEGSNVPNDRNLIPTWNFNTGEGHSATDNWFVCVDGDDFQPDMAIGRFPVTLPEEVGDIVRKTVRYASHNGCGDWRRRALFITNESPRFQEMSDRMAGIMESEGFEITKVYPQSKEKSNEQHTQRILDELNAGQLLVNFHGHGGRYIWRTGPPDYKKNHDLFTLDHLERLEPTDKISFVISLTCYSAPFDHPTADSIGEKFLRLPDRGAIGVFAASWRNTPSLKMGLEVTRELLRPIPVGEALTNLKHTVRSRILVEQYNLLGDPAIVLAQPCDDRPGSS